MGQTGYERKPSLGTALSKGMNDTPKKRKKKGAGFSSGGHKPRNPVTEGYTIIDWKNAR